MYDFASLTTDERNYIDIILSDKRLSDVGIHLIIATERPSSTLFSDIVDKCCKLKVVCGPLLSPSTTRFISKIEKSWLDDWSYKDITIETGETILRIEEASFTLEDINKVIDESNIRNHEGYEYLLDKSIDDIQKTHPHFKEVKSEKTILPLHENNDFQIIAEIQYLEQNIKKDNIIPNETDSSVKVEANILPEKKSGNLENEINTQPEFDTTANDKNKTLKMWIASIFISLFCSFFITKALLSFICSFIVMTIVIYPILGFFIDKKQ